ncbi:hypothetical protein GGTG_01415 [Gaeumannomyces tritici R3-111a-1]|uniref:Uncharacterized protein n=1 Tax=Gaeumannomyces tritici (strain R3-111a-1) TaxID=644352 RepID=J3NJI3_GAET3|nr:hypothetical protein GGTG_01415 [Gaeumannomyces tritici R3-111a-1]EJT81435.1 hypothetical protein GGTG_01415 [Gaeumannomyces tritici R3-111a-1]
MPSPVATWHGAEAKSILILWCDQILCRFPSLPLSAAADVIIESQAHAAVAQHPRAPVALRVIRLAGHAPVGSVRAPFSGKKPGCKPPGGGGRMFVPSRASGITNDVATAAHRLVFLDVV